MTDPYDDLIGALFGQSDIGSPLWMRGLVQPKHESTLGSFEKRLANRIGVQRWIIEKLRVA